jgi:hypothetical protein
LRAAGERHGKIEKQRCTENRRTIRHLTNLAQSVAGAAANDGG